MIVIFIVLSIFFSNVFSQNSDNVLQEKESQLEEKTAGKIKTYFSVSSERTYEIIISESLKDTTVSGIGNYQIRDSQNIYLKGCCVGNVVYESKQSKDELFLSFNKSYKLKIQYYFYNDISTAYERVKYVNFTTPPYDEKIKSFFIEVKFNKAGGVSFALANQN